MRILRAPLATSALAACLACTLDCSSPGPSHLQGLPQEPGSSGAPGTTPPFATGDAGSLFTGDGGGAVGEDGCTDAARLVYVVSEGGELESFDPAHLAFTKIGTLGCKASRAAYPSSMAVDRAGTAWVNYSDGTLFKVSTKDASCEATSFKPSQANITMFGMGFATNGPATKDETLYICDLAGSGLATIDLQTLEVAYLGGFGAAMGGQGCELTGTGDGRLFGFFTSTPASLAEIARAPVSARGTVNLAGVQTGDAWAFSFWGGDFYLYAAAPYDASHPFSDVWRYGPTDKSLTKVLSNVGIRIVGAGVSTCAPTKPVLK